VLLHSLCGRLRLRALRLRRLQLRPELVVLRPPLELPLLHDLRGERRFVERRGGTRRGRARRLQLKQLAAFELRGGDRSLEMRAARALQIECFCSGGEGAGENLESATPVRHVWMAAACKCAPARLAASDSARRSFSADDASSSSSAFLA
jgi:hypothetical protein